MPAAGALVAMAAESHHPPAVDVAHFQGRDLGPACSQDPEGKASDHGWDRLRLQEDGKYDLVQGGPTKAKSEKTGFWTFTGGDPAQVKLDHAGYPAVVKCGEVRLMIDYDTGVWYSKSK